MVAFPEKKLWFPDPRHYDEYMNEGMLAVGGEMSVERLRLAYSMGIFPWTDHPVTWWCPDPRGIIDLDHVRVGRSLARARRKGVLRCTINQSFEEVVTACAETPRPGSWITKPFIRAYLEMHQAGYAHSVECWQEEKLVGGIYGVSIGGLFAGESMFYRASNASKIALLHLVDHLRERGYRLFDVQMVTPVTESLGAIHIGRNEYLDRLQDAVKCPCTFGCNVADSPGESSIH